MSGFLERVGGMLVAPGATLAAVADGAGGLGDMAALFAAKVLADQTPLIVRACLAAPALGLGVALQGMMQASSSLLPDALGILIGAVALALLGGGAGRGKGREVELAAYAWIPFLAAKVLAALAFTALGRAPSSTEEAVVDALAVGWSALAWTAALLLRRSAVAGKRA